MSDAGSRNSAANTRGKPFALGNPGKPKGARHKVTLAVEELLDGEAEKLTRKAIDMALAGDVVALKMCIDRLAPARRDRAVRFRAPKISGPADVPAALAAVFKAVAAGEVTPQEGQALAAIVEKTRGALELAEIDRRLAALEEKGEAR
ncbi:hypothetical protein [Phenylobacterium sp.]|uniref:hypothetical protein n=1 Tax=Phenylobacterium sp. TaxID=1871053 RepID=UPI0035B3D769